VADYGRAVRHLQRARRDGALDAEAASMLDTAARVLAFDPGARGISSRERVRRIVRAYDIAAAWAARCPSSDIVVDVRRQLDAARATATERALGRDPDAADRVLALVATAESAASRACPPASGEERALALVAGAPPAAP
jgi:hypothetical protein